MICLRKGEKILPASVINQLLDDRVAEIEAAEAREVYRRERRRLKDEIIVDLLPRALTRHTDLFAYIDTRNGLVVVDTPTASKAEDLISQLRATLGTFKATPLEVNESASGAMTRWLNGAPLPTGFELGDRIGAGAMGTVYRAFQRALGVHRVVKTLHPHLAEDLDVLAEQGRLIRTHGGAIAPRVRGQDLAYDVRDRMQQTEKAAIGRLAATRVNDGESIIVDASTTSLYLARELMQRTPGQSLTIVTNSIRMASELAGRPG